MESAPALNLIRRPSVDETPGACRRWRVGRIARCEVDPDVRGKCIKVVNGIKKEENDESIETITQK